MKKILILALAISIWSCNNAKKEESMNIKVEEMGALASGDSVKLYTLKLRLTSQHFDWNQALVKIWIKISGLSSSFTKIQDFVELAVRALKC